jgi:menaquinone-dependent protoporphyrinogen IX oxidase
MNGFSRALIVYGTSYGATKGTSEEIAKILREEGFDVKVVNAKEEKIKDIAEYGLIVIGSSLAGCRWNSDVEDFLNKFQRIRTQEVGSICFFRSTNC